MIHRQDPQAALDGTSAFATEIIETKRRGANVATHANEIDRPGTVAWRSPTPAVARESDASGSDQSGEGNYCEWCVENEECSCTTCSSKVDKKMTMDESTPNDEHKSSSTGGLGSGLLR